MLSFHAAQAASAASAGALVACRCEPVCMSCGGPGSHQLQQQISAIEQLDLQPQYLLLSGSRFAWPQHLRMRMPVMACTLAKDRAKAACSARVSEVRECNGLHSEGTRQRMHACLLQGAYPSCKQGCRGMQNHHVVPAAPHVYTPGENGMGGAPGSRPSNPHLDGAADDGDGPDSPAERSSHERLPLRCHVSGDIRHIGASAARQLCRRGQRCRGGAQGCSGGAHSGIRCAPDVDQRLRPLEVLLQADACVCTTARHMLLGHFHQLQQFHTSGWHSF